MQMKGEVNRTETWGKDWDSGWSGRPVTNPVTSSLTATPRFVKANCAGRVTASKQSGERGPPVGWWWTGGDGGGRRPRGGATAGSRHVRRCSARVPPPCRNLILVQTACSMAALLLFQNKLRLFYKNMSKCHSWTDKNQIFMAELI